MNPITILLFLTTIRAFASDPSATPEKDPTGQKAYVERYRIVVDLDGDGSKDLILSDGPAAFGKSGGSWTVYLSRNGDFNKVGEITAHPKAISIEPDQDRGMKEAERRKFARIWVYLRSSGSAGTFGYFRVGERGVDELQRLEIYPGDGGTVLGNAIYDATFKNSPIAFTVESSTTSDAGAVTWSPVEG
ncbi:MAG: hypothetical protein V4689_23540 [Verrucomicrobiota bacterium]